MSEAQIYTKDQTVQQINNRLLTLNNHLNPKNVPFAINLLNPSEGYANDYSCGIYMCIQWNSYPQMFIDLFIPVSYLSYKQIVDKMNKDGWPAPVYGWNLTNEEQRKEFFAFLNNTRLDKYMITNLSTNTGIFEPIAPFLNIKGNMTILNSTPQQWLSQYPWYKFAPYNALGVQADIQSFLNNVAYYVVDNASIIPIVGGSITTYQDTILDSDPIPTFCLYLGNTHKNGSIILPFIPFFISWSEISSCYISASTSLKTDFPSNL